MPTLKKLKQDRLSITSKILKKDEDFLSISPEFIEDLKNKTLLENSALKLSISDYELMCRKDKVLNMMAIALNKPKAKLKKFCKHITVFKENIFKSPKSIANKINGINGPITNLPIGVRSIILDKFAEILPTKYVLLDWIDKDKLYWTFLSSNLNAIDLLKDRIEYETSLTNEQYIYLNNNQDKIDWDFLSSNPNAIHLLEKNLNKINWEYLSANPNAIELLKKNQDKINWDRLSANPNAIKLLNKKIKYEETLTEEDLDYLDLKDKINWHSLSTNLGAIQLLLENKNKIIWYWLSQNSNAIKLLNKRIKYEETLTEEDLDSLDLEDRIDWHNLSANPNVIELLKKNQDKIRWDYLSKNPNAIDLLKDRIKYEKSLTDAQLDQLKNKINWNDLSKNSNVIELLKKNQDKINWYQLSENPNAIDLLKDRIKYEKSLTDAQFNRLKNKINWSDLSKNSNAIDLLKENQDKIDWFALSSNPSIFKAV